jgi:prevent-host-death family protein
MVTKRIGAREARQKFSDLVGTVHYGGQTVIIERSGKPMVAVIPVEVYQQLIAEREARFQVLDRVQGRLPDVPPRRSRARRIRGHRRCERRQHPTTCP